jgi:hypothetical protein
MLHKTPLGTEFWKTIETSAGKIKYRTESEGTNYLIHADRQRELQYLKI